jgi:hypothetical protein
MRPTWKPSQTPRHFLTHIDVTAAQSSGLGWQSQRRLGRSELVVTEVLAVDGKDMFKNV